VRPPPCAPLRATGATTVGSARAPAAQRAALLTAALLASALSAGCVRKPACTRADLTGCVVSSVQILGNRAASDDDIEAKIATIETSHAITGLVERLFGIIDYRVLDPLVLERDLARVERYYRSIGYYEAHVRAGRVIRRSDDTVEVEIVVDEGPLVRVGEVELVAKPPGTVLPATLIDAENTLAHGAPFKEDQLDDTKKKMRAALTDKGFAYATVEGQAFVDLTIHEARVTFTADFGPPCTFGPIRFEGLGELPDGIIRAFVGFHEGQPFSTAKLDDAQKDLAALGVLGSIDLVQDRSPADAPKNPVVPIVIRVQPAAMRSIRLGFGAELGGWVEAHGLAGWENRNFFGGMRRLSVEVRPGLLFYPLRIDTLFNDEQIQVLPQISLRTELKQPVFFDPRSNLIARVGLNLYRLQSSNSETIDSASAALGPIVGYREAAGAIGVERSFWKSRLRVGLFQNEQFDNPFSYNSDPVPAGFANLVISYVDANATVDLRYGENGKPDRISPHSGVYFSLDAQAAYGGTPSATPPSAGGSSSPADFRLSPEARAYVPIASKVTLAYRLAGGFLFPRNYGTLLTGGGDPCPANDALCEARRANDLQLLQFRAFFSGGPNSNRGYPYNGVGPQENINLLNPTQPGPLIPTGGLGRWESSLELRLSLPWSLGTVLFLDGSNVTQQLGELGRLAPHLSAGLGLRYATPVGPLRFDVGYRIPCAQVIGTCSNNVLPPPEVAPTLVDGIPLAFSIAIGEAF
jgi:outer membrane protein assembly factor BamA